MSASNQTVLNCNVEEVRKVQLDNGVTEIRVFYRRNSQRKYIRWDPRYGRIPEEGDAIRLTFGGCKDTAKLKKVERRKPRSRGVCQWVRDVLHKETPYESIVLDE